MNLALLIVAIAAGLSLLMAAAWWVAITTGRSGFVDAVWSYAVGAAGVAAALAPLDGTEETSARQILVAILAMLWSLRLGFHILRRTLKGGDDPRYAQLRREWGDAFPQRLFVFLQIQAGAAFLLALAMLAAARNPSPSLDWLDGAAILVFLAAVAGETIADNQLEHFRADPAHQGRVCDAGLWSWSRHPNYFFEWLGWVAYPLIAIDLSGGYPLGLVALAAPVFMYWLLVHVSGVPPLEAHMLRSRGASFRAYQEEVSAFWPWPRRSKVSSPKQGRSA